MGSAIYVRLPKGLEKFCRRLAKKRGDKLCDVVRQLCLEGAKGLREKQRNRIYR